MKHHNTILYILLCLSNATYVYTKIIPITTEEQLLQVLCSDKPTLVMGSMNKCPFCTMMEPVMQSWSKQYPKIKFYSLNGPKLNMHRHVKKLTSNAFSISGYPVFMFVHDKKITKMILGASKEKLKKAIQEFIQEL